MLMGSKRPSRWPTPPKVRGDVEVVAVEIAERVLVVEDGIGAGPPVLHHVAERRSARRARAASRITSSCSGYSDSRWRTARAMIVACAAEMSPASRALAVGSCCGDVAGRADQHHCVLASSSATRWVSHDAAESASSAAQHLSRSHSPVTPARSARRGAPGSRAARPARPIGRPPDQPDRSSPAAASTASSTTEPGISEVSQQGVTITAAAPTAFQPLVPLPCTAANPPSFPIGRKEHAT